MDHARRRFLRTRTVYAVLDNLHTVPTQLSACNRGFIETSKIIMIIMSVMETYTVEDNQTSKKKSAGKVVFSPGPTHSII